MVILVAVGLVGLYVAGAGGGFPLDDSWIHQTYARNLAQSGQWAFVPGVPSAASTSPLYTVLLALGYKLGFPHRAWTHVLGTLALATAGILATRLTWHLVPHQRLIGLVSGLTVVLVWQLVWAASSGMETMLFSALTLALIWLAWREQDERNPSRTGGRGLVFGILAALTTLTRPEGVLLAVLIGVVILFVRPQRTWLGALLWCGGAVLGFIVTSAPYLLFNWQLTGGLLPNTAAAKQAEYAPLLAQSYPQRLFSMLTPLFAGGQLLLLPGIVFFALTALRRLSQDRAALFQLLPLAWALILVALYAARLSAAYQHGRYVMPALPSFVICGVVGTLELARAELRSKPGRIAIRSLLLATGIVFAYFAVVAGPRIYSRDVSIIDQEMVASAKWIAANLPAEELLAVHDIGAVGYFASRPILDLAGLVNPEIVLFIRDGDALWNWLEENDAHYLMAFPDQIPGQSADDERLCPIFTTEGTASLEAGGDNMRIYLLAWDGDCP